MNKFSVLLCNDMQAGIVGLYFPTFFYVTCHFICCSTCTTLNGMKEHKKKSGYVNSVFLPRKGKE